jgi:hypothetical protein
VSLGQREYLSFGPTYRYITNRATAGYHLYTNENYEYIPIQLRRHSFNKTPQPRKRERNHIYIYQRTDAAHKTKTQSQILPGQERPRASDVDAPPLRKSFHAATVADGAASVDCVAPAPRNILLATPSRRSIVRDLEDFSTEYGEQVARVDRD